MIKNYIPKKNKLLKGIGFGIIFVVIVMGIGLIVNLLWNWLMPEIFNLSRISYLQALGLLVLSKILFGSIGSDNANKKEEPILIKNSPASYEERLYEEWWQKSGEQSFESYLNQKTTEEKTDEGQ